MAKDQLFLLKPGFLDAGKGPFYCPSCATLEGLLGYYPALRDSLEVHHLDFPRPRAALIAEIGADNQGLPVLVLAPGTGPSHPALAGLDLRTWQGRLFLQSPGDIGRYLARTRGSGEPH